MVWSVAPLESSTGDLTQAFVTSTAAMVIVVDGAGRIQLVNPAVEAFTGLTAAELTGRFFWDVYVVPEDVAPAQEAVRTAMSTAAAFAIEADWLDADGARRRVVMHNSVLPDLDGRPAAIACVAIDVTEVHQRSTVDPLTGARNRAGLFEALNRHLHPERGEGCAVLFCDLDDFKLVNDAYGHTVGDRLLVEVAHRLRDTARPTDTVARIGGDEFVVVCPAGDEASLAALVQRVAARLHEPLPTAAGPIDLRVSIGAAVGHPGEDPDDVLTHADSAMYRIKHRRRARR
ncbi:sensor domain-containing diguanylate cyclase [Geodermatophilus sp. URMC 64]